MRSRRQAFEGLKNKIPLDFRRAAECLTQKSWPGGRVVWGKLPTWASTEGAQIFTVAEGVPGDPLWNSEPLRA